MKLRKSFAILKAPLCALSTVGAAISVAFAQPQYVQVGALPVPTASERGEVWDAATGTLFSFPYYNSGDLTLVYCSQPGTNDNFVWTQTTNFPARTTYWGRGAADGSHLYYCGTIDNVSLRNGFGANGLLGSWQSMTTLPTVGCTGLRCPLRSLHQAFIFQSRLYVLGGWYGDGLPSYSDMWYAAIQGGGSVGSFVQTTSLPYGMAGHSAAVSPSGKLYLAHDTNLFAAQIMGDGSVSSWVAQRSIPGMNLNNAGNGAMAAVSNLLVIVDYNSTFVCRLNSTGNVSRVLATISNPAYLNQRSVYANLGKIYVTGTSGKVYRIDGLPFSDLPTVSIRVSQVELCWDTTPTNWYQLQYESSLTTNQWVPFMTNWVAGDGGRYCTNDAILANQTQRYYRVAVTNSPP